MIVIPLFVRTQIKRRYECLETPLYHIPTKTWWREDGFGLEPFPDLSCGVAPGDLRSLEKIKKKYWKIAGLKTRIMDLSVSQDFDYCILDDDRFYYGSCGCAFYDKDGPPLWELDPDRYVWNDVDAYKMKSSRNINGAWVCILDWALYAATGSISEDKLYGYSDKDERVRSGYCRSLVYFSKTKRLGMWDIRFERDVRRIGETDATEDVLVCSFKGYSLWDGFKDKSEPINM